MQSDHASRVCDDDEHEMEINGTSAHVWSFNQTVPGPLLRVEQGNTVTVQLSNDAASKYMHSIDLHAVNGPDGQHRYASRSR